MKRIHLGVLGSALLLLAACGDGKPTAPRGSITQTAAQSFVSGNSDQLFAGVNPYDQDGVSSAFIDTRRRVDISSCSNKGGTQTDADGDQIPVNLVTTLDCDVFGKLTGTTTLKDADDTKAFPLAGFSFALDLLWDFGMGNQKFPLTITGSFDAGITGATATANMEAKTELDAGQASLKSGFYLTSSVTGAVFRSDSRTPSAGKINISGFVELVGATDDEKVDYVLQVTGTDLTIGDCSGDAILKDGTLTLAAEVGKITATFDNCNATWKYNDDVTLTAP